MWHLSVHFELMLFEGFQYRTKKEGEMNRDKIKMWLLFSILWLQIHGLLFLINVFWLNSEFTTTVLIYSLAGIPLIILLIYSVRLFIELWIIVIKGLRVDKQYFMWLLGSLIVVSIYLVWLGLLFMSNFLC